MSSFEFSDRDDTHREFHPQGPDDLNEGYDEVAALTPDEEHVEPIPEDLPEADEAFADRNREATGTGSDPERRFTVVEFGSGRDPILNYRAAPDMTRLYTEGGEYVGVDASPRYLRLGELASRSSIEENPAEGVDVSAEFRRADIQAGVPLPETLEPDSADRVIVKNLLTNHPIATDPAACDAIAEAARTVVRKDPAGEVVAVGTYTPEEFPAQAAIELFTAHGFNHVGSDDASAYYPEALREHIGDVAYAERFRLQAETAPEAPFSVVEIGAGIAPLLLSPYAPDMERLYREGGTYTAVDASPHSLNAGQENSQLFLNIYTAPDATIDTNFVPAVIAPENPLPEGLSPDSTKLVVISNLLTFPPVARDPEVCSAIASTAQTIVSKDPPGEVLVIGLLSPQEYTKERVTALMEAAGLEHVGSDDIAQYFPPDQRDMTYLNPYSYAERYRPRREEPQQ